jgi:Fur family ferric uptake transcriptional regulator
MHCNALQILSEFRLSKTPHRIYILELLIGAEHLLSAGEIANTMKGRKGINKVTIYRMLNTFKDAGIVREVITEQGIRLYEIACRHNPVHPHFYCVKCGKMDCMNPSIWSECIKSLKDNPFKVESVSIHVSGVCAQCFSKS